MDEMTMTLGMRPSSAEIAAAGVDVSVARQHRVTDGCAGIPVGAWVGIDVTDTEIADGELYLIRRVGVHQVRYLWTAGDAVMLGRSPRAPTAWVDIGEIDVIGRVFWMGVMRPLPEAAKTHAA